MLLIKNGRVVDPKSGLDLQADVLVDGKKVVKIAGNIVLFDRVSIDVASVGRVLVSDKTFNTPFIAIHCSNAQNVGFENPTYAKLIKCSLYGCVKTISMPFEHNKVT